MIFGFRANLTIDTDRILLTRLANSEIDMKAVKTANEPYQYSFVIDEIDLKRARTIREVMTKTYTNIPEI